MWRYGVVHVAVIYSVYQIFGFYYGIVALLALIYCIDKLLDKFGYERLVPGDLLLTLEAPNQNHNIGGYFTINKIKFEEFRQGVYKRAILNLRKMSMIQIERFGFKLWKDVDRELSINQILECKANLKTEVECLEYLNNILDENMDYSKPLWEFHFVENFSKDLSVIIVRTHHSFTDAIGFASMMSCMNDDQFIHKIDKKFPSLSLIQKLILILITPFYIIYAMIVTAGITSDPNSATINDLNNKPRTILNKFYISEKFEFEDIRKCYKKFKNTTFHEYMLGILSVCISKWCHANEVFNLSNLKIWFPVNMRPLPNNMNEINLNNCLTSLLQDLPLNTNINQSLDYLKRNKNEFNNFKFLTCLSYFQKILPLLPEIIVRKLFSDFFVGVYMMFSNIPFPSESFHICNREVTDVALFANYFYNCRINFVAMTYKGKLKFMIMADRNLKMDPQQLINLVVDELKEQIAQCKTS